jgi:hypothetical protein
MGAAAFAQPAPKTARVTGRVVKQTGEGMRHATVTLLGAERYTATADANGVFALDNIAPGRYALIAQHVGYASQKYGAAAPLARTCSGMDDVSHQAENANGGYDVVAHYRQCIEQAPGTMLSLTAGREMKDLAIQVAQHGVISGKVLNQDGEPVPGSVAALRVVYEGGTRHLQTESSSNIGPDGEYTVDDLPAGRYYLRTGSGMTISSPAQGKPAPEGDVATYYPSELDESKAGVVEVKPGEESSGIDILMRRVGVFTVRGTVASPPGVPAGNGWVMLTPKGAGGATPGLRLSSIGAKGEFEIRDVEPGAYVISNLRLGVGQPIFQRQDVVVSAADVEGVHLTPVQGIALAGTVKMEGPAPENWPTVALAAPHQAADPGGIGMLDAYAGASVKPDSSGAFTFPAGMAPSQYEVRLDALPPGTYVKSIRYGDQDALHGPLDLTGGAAGSLDVALSSKVAAITGKVKNAKDEAAAGVLVTAWPRKPGFAGGVHSAPTDQNGNFAIADLGPGDYYVAAWEDIDPGLADTPEFLARFQTDAVAATLAEGGRASADVSMIPRERISAEMEKLP